MRWRNPIVTFEFRHPSLTPVSIASYARLMPSDHAARSADLLSAGASLLLVIDLQERLMPHIEAGEAVAANCIRLMRGAGLFDVPVVLSEQYPKGLGPTVPSIASVAGEVAARTTEKLRFSAAESTGWPAAGERPDGRHQAVLCGIETHVCVAQTAFDLLSQGYRVFVVADAVGSRRALDHEVAKQRLRDGGAILVTTESVLFEWCEVAGTERFRKVRDLVTGRTEGPAHPTPGR